MKIYERNYISYKIYNPVTNEIIVDAESVYENAVSLIAWWLDDFFDEPVIRNGALTLAWDAYASENNVIEVDFEKFDRFLNDYENADWIVFKVTSNPFPDVSNDTWMVVVKDCVITEDNGQEKIISLLRHFF